MIATYSAALAVIVASLAIGQGALALCGVRRWSWLAPGVGLGLLCAISWATVRLPGGGATSAAAVGALGLVAAVLWLPRVGAPGEQASLGPRVGVVAAAIASLPFLVEGHFGILGTGFNPDMSQHLLATVRLADGAEGELLRQGYPLGPHAIAVALDDGLGIGLVQGFGGLTLAVAVLAPLTALAAFRELPATRAIPVALLVGLPYLVASYYAQGSFKETMQALFLLAFVLSLREASRNAEWRDLPLRFVPAALIAVGSVYVYSFPGLLWLGGTFVVWLLLERKLPLRPLPLALAVFLIGTLPELGRMIDFQRFETFDPSGPGLGNLFGQLSPFTALGIWPSGDFRVAAGDGAVPAFVYYLGAALGAALLALGVTRCWRLGEKTIVAGLTAAGSLYLAARLGGTPYTSAKALGMAAPLVALAILSPAGGAVAGVPHSGGRRRRPSTWGRAAATGPAAMRIGPAAMRIGPAAMRLMLVIYLAAAGACSLLAFANAPVGPTAYSPRLTELRPLIATDSTLVVAPDQLIDEEQGERYIAWELRGGRVCIEREREKGAAPPAGIRFVVMVESSARWLRREFTPRRYAAPYELWERRRDAPGPGPCPLIAVRQARQGP